LPREAPNLVLRALVHHERNPPTSTVVGHFHILSEASAPVKGCGSLRLDAAEARTVG